MHSHRIQAQAVIDIHTHNQIELNLATQIFQPITTDVSLAESLDLLPVDIDIISHLLYTHRKLSNLNIATQQDMTSIQLEELQEQLFKDLSKIMPSRSKEKSM